MRKLPVLTPDKAAMPRGPKRLEQIANRMASSFREPARRHIIDVFLKTLPNLVINDSEPNSPIFAPNTQRHENIVVFPYTHIYAPNYQSRHPSQQSLAKQIGFGKIRANLKSLHENARKLELALENAGYRVAKPQTTAGHGLSRSSSPYGHRNEHVGDLRVLIDAGHGDQPPAIEVHLADSLFPRLAEEYIASGGLDKRDLKIYEHYAGINGKRKLNQTDIAEKFGLTQPMVGRIIAKKRKQIGEENKTLNGIE